MMLPDNAAARLAAAHLDADLQTVCASLKNIAELAMLVPEGECINMGNLACSLTMQAEKLEAIAKMVGPACVD